MANALERCGVHYLVGGSLASSVRGEPRSNLVVSLKFDQVEPLLALLRDDFCADPENLREAVRTRSSANLIHQGTSTKVDLFVLGGSPLDEEQMARRVRLRVTSDPEQFVYVYTGGHTSAEAPLVPDG